MSTAATEKAYRIKPLEWTERKNGLGHCFVARTIHNDLYVTRFTPSTDWEARYDGWTISTHKTPDDAKSAAEEWYRRLLLSALEELPNNTLEETGT